MLRVERIHKRRVRRLSKAMFVRRPSRRSMARYEHALELVAEWYAHMPARVNRKLDNMRKEFLDGNG